MPSYFHSATSPGVSTTRAEQDQLDFDLGFYDAILRRNENNVDVLRRQVELLARRGDYDKAYALDRRLVGLLPRDSIAHYNLACSLSMLGRIGAALKALEQALQLGYQDVAHLEADSDLDLLRHHPAYPRLLRKYGLMS
jgi:tetratricopeptide (TPR) repeat protein